MYPLFGVFLFCHICGWYGDVRYVALPDNWLLDFCMYGALTLVILFWGGYHRKLSVLLPLLVLFYIFLWGIQCIVGFYRTL